MKIEGEQVLFRVFLNVKSKFMNLVPLYKHFVSMALNYKMAGVTVLKGENGFVHTIALPSVVIIEIVDMPERVNVFIDKLKDFLNNVIVTIERAHVAMYRIKEEKGRDKFDKLTEFSNHYSRKNEVVMDTLKEKVLIRVFVGENDRDFFSKRHISEIILDEAKKEGFDFGFVIKGTMGFGKAGRFRASETIELSADMPVVIELIGDEEKARTFVSFLDRHVGNGLVTYEKVLSNK